LQKFTELFTLTETERVKSLKGTNAEKQSVESAAGRGSVSAEEVEDGERREGFDENGSWRWWWVQAGEKKPRGKSGKYGKYSAPKAVEEAGSHGTAGLEIY
jgi:hypothetical protein